MGVFWFVCGGTLRDQIEGFDAELHAIYLLQEKQKRGMGKAFDAATRKHLYDKGLRSLIVWVLAKNPAV